MIHYPAFDYMLIQTKFTRRKQMKVVVCDDSMEDLEKIRGLLTKYVEKNERIQLETEYFMYSAELYRRIQSKAPGDIYILDMIMNEKTGIDIGSLIRSRDADSVIIYVTSSDDFALEAYGVRAVRYLLKPVREELFIEAMDYAVTDISKEKKETIYTVKTKEGLVSIPYSRIEYIENYSRTLHICLTDQKRIQSIFIRKSFNEEIRQLMESDNFVQVHKSFVVNLCHVEKLASGSVLMKSGAAVPVSKTRTADVKRAYLKFVSEQYP